MTDGLPHHAPLRELTRDFAATAAAHDREGSFPHQNFRALHAAGLLGLTVPREFGGEGAGLARTVAVVGTVAEGCPATALILAMQLIQHRTLAREPAWAALRARLGESAVRDGALINGLRVEPELGTPARGGLPATRLRRQGEGWVLNGRKIYSTGAPGLRWMLVWAATEEEQPRAGLVLVPADAPGVRIEESWDQAGLRASGSHDVVLEGVALPAGFAPDLRPLAAWGRPDSSQAAWNALPVAALYTGVARAARNWLVSFLNTRKPANLGAALSTLPRMQEAVGQIEARLLTNDRLVATAAEAEDRGEGPSAAESGLIKTVAAENSIAAVQEAVALCGNHALARSNPLERHLRDVLCARIHTPQPDAAYTAAGRLALGLS